MTARIDQETTIALGREDDIVRIFTSDTRHLARLRKFESFGNPVREVRGGVDWAEFEVDVSFFHLFSAFRRKRVLSEAERAIRAERLAAVRTAAGGGRSG